MFRNKETIASAQLSEEISLRNTVLAKLSDYSFLDKAVKDRQYICRDEQPLSLREAINANAFNIDGNENKNAAITFAFMNNLLLDCFGENLEISLIEKVIFHAVISAIQHDYEIEMRKNILDDLAKKTPSQAQNEFKKIHDHVTTLIRNAFISDNSEQTFRSSIVHALAENKLKNQLFILEKIHSLLLTYRTTLDNADTSSEIYKNRDKLYALKCKEEQSLIKKLTSKKNNLPCINSFEQSITSSINVINNLNNMKEVTDETMEHPLLKSSLRNTHQEGYELAYQLIKTSNTNDVNFLAENIEKVTTFVQKPSHSTLQQLTDSVRNMEDKSTFKRYALSVASVVMGSLIIAAGAAVIAMSTVSAISFASTGIGAIVGAAIGFLGWKGGAALVGSGAGFVTAGTIGIKKFGRNSLWKEMANHQCKIINNCPAASESSNPSEPVNDSQCNERPKLN